MGIGLAAWLTKPKLCRIKYSKIELSPSVVCVARTSAKTVAICVQCATRSLLCSSIPINCDPRQKLLEEGDLL